MQTWKFEVGAGQQASYRVLSNEEAESVTGGIAPIAAVAVQAAIGAATSAANAHGSGGNVMAAAILGGAAGAIGGVASLVWNTSKVLSVTIGGVGAALYGSSAYAIGLFPRTMKEHL
jgi:lactobin A/cerein 7B family class IIb bacteriocin